MLIQRVYRAVHWLRRLWWWLRRPTNHGAMVAVWCGPKVLLVRTSYRPGWTLPGGFVDRGESLAQAAARELAEEVGIVVDAEDLRESEVIFHTTEHLKDHVHVFEVRVDATPPVTVDGREVVEAAFVEGQRADERQLFPPVREYLARIARRHTP